MSSTTAAGSKLAISAGKPATMTTAGFKALTYTSVGGVESIGGFGASTEVVSFQPLDGPTEKYKGPTNYGQLAPNMKVDDADAGQALIQTFSDPENTDLASIRITKPDGSLRFFQARVFGFPETIGAANSIIMATPAIEINTKVFKEAAPAA
jgi:hypothetical protein